MKVAKLINYPDLVEPPFTFNPLKHHLGYIRELTKMTGARADESEVFGLINSIGPQLTDIYCGTFSVNQLLAHIRSELTKNSVFEQPAYEKWVENSGKQYNFLELPDGSRWTFRKGEKKGRYIHFHPARLSCGFRIRGTTLRTAMALKITAHGDTMRCQDPEFINSIRIKRLQLSPVKNIQSFTAIRKILELLGE